MRELKKYHLLQVKEKLKRQKSINELTQLESDAEKCETIKKELNRLLSENHAVIEEIGVQSFVSNRRLDNICGARNICFDTFKWIVFSSWDNFSSGGMNDNVRTSHYTRKARGIPYITYNKT